MRKAMIILLGGFALGCLAFCAVYLAGTAPLRPMRDGKTTELLWLRKEFQLTDQQFIQVSQLHEAYLPACQKRRVEIAAMGADIRRRIEREPAVTPEIENLIKERGQMFAECQLETLRHCRAVSQVMSPDQSKRYLAWVMEKTCLSEPMGGPHEAASMDSDAGQGMTQPGRKSR